MNKNGTIGSLITEVNSIYSQKEVANYFGVDRRTIQRWEIGECTPPPYARRTLRQLLLPFNLSAYEPERDFTFIDLFAGIGGIRLGFEAHGGKSLFTSEWNEQAVETYRANFNDDHPIVGDITKAPIKLIPDHDVLLAGFPCQPFSIAGVSKKNSLGREHGFQCKTQGTLFFDVARIIEAKRPAAFLLENVKNLVSHDQGRTFKVIKETLKDELGYDMHYKVIDGQHFVPQHRERIYMVGFREKTNFTWDDLKLPPLEKGPKIENILHSEDGTETLEEPFTAGKNATVNKKYILSDHLWKYLQDYAAKHQAKGNGFGFGLVKKGGIARTLSARYYKDGSEVLIDRGRGKNPRRLTPRECSRLMGFDHNKKKFKITVSDTQAYKQFGNAVVVPVIKEIARIMKPHVMALKAEATSKIKMTA
ncbi:MAG: DNA (cytosine-5-)-methyltransferase [Nitrospinae bacterium]|nr:DNA (cytosine-5-)-methyltransferase [Nitrospinota bacterium]